MTSLRRHVTHHMTPNYAKVSIKVWIFFGQSFTDVALGVPKILRGGTKCPPPPWIHWPKKPMVNRVKIGHFTKENIFVKKNECNCKRKNTLAWKPTSDLHIRVCSHETQSEIKLVWVHFGAWCVLYLHSHGTLFHFG